MTPQAHASDEISLRDLYLILKRGLPLIILVSVIAGTAAFTYGALQPASYQAESTTVINAPQFRFSQVEGIDLRSGASVSFEAYETLAFSRTTLEAALADVPEADISVEDLRRRGELEKLYGPSRAGEEASLAVVHKVTGSDQELAAKLANAWGESSLKIVRDTVLDDLNPVGTTTASQIERRRARLKRVEETLREFQSEYNLDLLEERYTRATSRVAASEERLDDLAQDIGIAETRLTTLETQLDSERRQVASTDPTSDTFLAGLSLDRAQALLVAQRDKADQEYQGARAALDRFDETHNLALLQRRIDALNAEVASKEARLARLPGELERAETKRAQLQTQVDDQGERLVLRDTVVSNPVLSEVLRGSANGDQTSLLFGAELSSEVLNPIYTDVFSRLLAEEVTLQDLYTEQEVLIRELEQNRDALGRYRRDLTALESEWERLNTQLQQAQNVYLTVSERLDEVRYAVLDARSAELSLRDPSPEVSQLQANIREEQLQLDSLRSEQSLLEARLERDQERLSVVQRDLAELSEQRSELERERDDARTAYQEVVKLEPIVSYATELAPSAARMLSAASVPAEPVGPRVLLMTALAVVLAGMLGVLFVFLREAVAAPIESPASLPRQQAKQRASAFSGD